MVTKLTYSIPGFWDVNTDSANVTSSGLPAKQLSTGGTEISHLKLSAGSTAAHVDLYDWVDTGVHTPPSTAKKWVLDCSTTVNDVDNFTNSLVFKNGVFAVCTQGSISAQVSIAIIPSQV